MYNNYNSLKESIQKEIDNQKSVLNKFPENISRPIAQSCSKYLAQFTSYQFIYKLPPNNANSTAQSSVNNNANLNQDINIINQQTSSSIGVLTNNSTNQANLNNPNLNSTNIHVPGDNVNLNVTSSSNILANTNNSSSGNDITNSINDPISNHSESNNSEKINIIQLETAEQVNWTLENLMYGLTLSHEHLDIIKDCWNVYHDWLSVLLDEPKAFVPQPIKDDPIYYSKKMLWHLYHLFVPRKESLAPTKHIMMCHGVLILIEGIAKDSKLMKRDLWEEFLKFFLAINDAVLSPPFNKDDFGDILSSRIVATLFEIWLIACNKVFPSPSLWKTFQELCSNWRHHISLVIEWNRVCYALTNRLLELTWWPESSSSNTTFKPINDTNVAYDIQTIIGMMNTETVTQSWFRFLHIIGKPIDFCDVISISKSLEIARANRLLKDNENYINMSANFSCIKKLPIIFLEFIKGISRIVDAFLGLNLVTNNHLSSPNSKMINQMNLDQKNRSKSMLISSASVVSVVSNSIDATLLNLRLNLYKSNRPNVNSLLHLVGQWLFDASIKHLPNENDQSSHGHYNKDYVHGQAEAFGLLCKIFCSVKTNENIMPDYLSRFYSLLSHGLRVPVNLGELNSNMEYEGGEILASIIVNGYNLFKLDLEGINVLLMPMLNALNAIFKLKYSQKEETKPSENKPKETIKTSFNIGSNTISLVELKRYCIYIFSSLLSLPNHFSSLNLFDLNANSSSVTFFSLKSKILEIFLAAMTNEQDTVNLQNLFGCGRLIIGEWSMDELLSQRYKCNDVDMANLDKKDKALYCYNQVVSLICAPLKINHSTLSNHSFALSIFDSLASIAAGDFLNEDESVCKIAISWIWHYVKMQIKRRSREHTREMHSVIVAAYNCLIMLLNSKPNLLRDKTCLQTVTNCIEIGISGSSSYPDQKLRDDSKESGQALMKAEKELKPASLRVKEAAECVLCFLMEHTSFSSGLFDMNDLIRTPLDERSLVDLTNKNPSTKFKYFAIDGSLIIALLEKPLVKSKISNVCPTTTVLLRGPFGRQAWSLHHRNSPFTDLENIKEIKLNSNRNGTLTNQVNKNSNTIRPDMSQYKQNLDDSEASKSIPKCELSIPTLNDVAMKSLKNLNQFQRLKEEQIEFENNSIDKALQDLTNNFSSNQNEISLNIKISQEFHSARMLLSHLGYCSLESSTRIVKDDFAEILSIDSNDPAFFDHLTTLDQLSTRTFSTSHIFYVKKNQSTSKSILNNISTGHQLDESFYSFIQSLGSIIDVTSNKPLTSPQKDKRRSVTISSTTPSNENLLPFTKKLNKINGYDNVLHWSDMSSEITFILPNNEQASTVNSSTELEDTHKVKHSSQNIPSDIRVLIIWLEQLQDSDNIPIDELICETYDSNTSIRPKEVIIIFVHPLKSKLNRIITWSNLNRKHFYTMPLTDGMVVSSRMLSSMIRQTVLNIFRRKRLEIDDYQPPHVRRKNKITEIIKKFQSKKSEADLFTSLLL